MKRPLRKRIKYSILYGLVKVMLFVSTAMPRTVWLKCCGIIGQVAFYVLPHVQKITIKNLTIAFALEKSQQEIKKLAKEVFVYLGKNAGDLFRSYKVGTLENLEKFLITHGMENYQFANAKGNGVIFLTCHLGAFDLQITNMALHGLQPLIIGSPLKDERLNKLLQNYRNAYGAISVERGKESVRLFKALKKGEKIALLIDQDTTVQSTFVNFFGQLASTPIGAAVLAVKTGAAVVPTYIYMDKDYRQHMYILPEVPIDKTSNDETDYKTNTQKFTTVIEQFIRQHPEQWVWMHERWKTKPV